MIFQKKSPRTKQRTFKVNNSELEVVKEYTYLGVTLSENGNFSNHQQKSKEKSLNALYSTNRFIELKKLKPQQANKIFNSMISPILTYASEVWGVYQKHDFQKWDKSQIEKMHLHYCKFYLGVNNKASNLACRAELGRFPLKIFIDKLILKFYNHLFSLSDNAFAKQAFSISKSLHEQGKTCYHSNLIQMLSSYEIYNEMNNSLTNNTISNYHDKMKKQYVKAWKSYLVQSRKLQVYKLIKTEYRIDNYLETIRNYEQRKLMTKFRICNHQLAVETGRYGKQKTQINERLCNYCNTSETETEEHMLLHCPRYSSLREQFFSKLSGETNVNTLNTSTSMVNLLSSNNPQLRFIYQSLF